MTRRDGFSLLELLSSTAILGIIMLRGAVVELTGLFALGCRALVRREDHEHLTAIHARTRLDPSEVITGLGNRHALAGTDVAVGVLATTEPHGDLYLVPLFEEASRMLGLHSHVVVVRLGTELHFLELLLDLVASRLGRGLALLVLHPTIIGDLTHRRTRIRSNFYEVESTVFRELDCILREELPKLVALLVDDEHTPHTNSAVDSRLVTIGFWTKSTTGTSAQKHASLSRAPGSGDERDGDDSKKRTAPDDAVRLSRHARI